MKRQKVLIYIDYTLRIPSFNKAYNSLKQYMFENNNEEYELEGDAILRDFWLEEIKKPEVSNFYLKTIAPSNDLDNKNWLEYFFSLDHYKKFLEDYSYNLYVDAEVPSNKDIQIIDIAQKHLFDVVLVDEFLNTRKKSNTLFYLSKIRVLPYSVIFIKEDEKLDEKEYFAIWNPKVFKDQINGLMMELLKIGLKN